MQHTGIYNAERRSSFRVARLTQPWTMLLPFDAGGKATLHVGDDGNYEVKLMATRRGVASEPVQAEPATIRVRRSLGLQVFAITIPDEELNKALERLALKSDR